MRRADWSLAAILLVALAVRAWGIGFGLPLTVCRPDEDLVVKPALEFFGGDLDPMFYRYGTLGSYLVHAAMRAGLTFQRLTGEVASTQEFILGALEDPSPWYLVARWIGVVAGVATVAIVFSI